MGEHIGVRTKLFPWLVEQELKETNIPEDDHARIVMAAQRIATAKENEQKKSRDEAVDNRPKTPQLISFGRGDAKRFVAKLVELRKPDNGANGTSDRYTYFLNPRVGFEEMVRDNLEESGLDEKVIDKIVKASWVIAKCRMLQLPANNAEQESEESPEASTEAPAVAMSGEAQPSASEAERIA